MSKHLKQQQRHPQQHRKRHASNDGADSQSSRQHRRPSTTTTSSTTSSSQQRKAKSSSGVVSLTSFAQRKGQIRALEEFKKRKEHKRVETAKTLRRYRKVMKQEGMEAGRGASRKRRFEEDNNEEDASNEEEEKESQNETILDTRTTPISEVDGKNSNTINHKKKKQRTNPLTKSVMKAQQAKEHAALQAHQEEEHEKERQQKLRQRKQQSKLLQKRTKRGQPIMKYMVDNLLHKLEKQTQTNQSDPKNIL